MPHPRRSAAPTTAHRAPNTSTMTPTPPSSPSSSSDTDDDIPGSALNARIRSAAVRRSARQVSEVDRFNPSALPSPSFRSSHSTNIFGDSTAPAASSSSIQRLIRECNLRKVSQEKVEQLRRDVETGADAISGEEKMFQSMADGEQEEEQTRLSAFQKYSAPLSTFPHKFCLPPLPAKLTSQDPHPIIRDAVNNLLCKAGRGKQFSGDSIQMLTTYVTTLAMRRPQKISSNAVEHLFHLTVHDDTPCGPGNFSRDGLFNALLAIVRRGAAIPQAVPFPPLSSTLTAYGAELNTCAGGEPPSKHDEMSLDAIVSTKEKIKTEEQREMGRIARRNVTRACTLAATQLRHSVPFASAIGCKQDATSGCSDELTAIDLCVKVLLSAFGSQLRDSISELISATLASVSDDDWAHFRLTVAKHIVSMAPRMGLHIELVTDLLPMACERALQCSLDVAYLSLFQWCTGPGGCPVARDVSAWQASANCVRLYGTDSLSFCVSDIVHLLEAMPVLDKHADVEWACGVSRLLKQLLTMPEVVVRRQEGEFGMVHSTVQKIRQCSRHMKFGVSVQEMRMTLDTLLRALVVICGSSRSGRLELGGPGAAIEKVQCKLLPS